MKNLINYPSAEPLNPQGRNIQWLVYGALYVLIVGIIAHPKIPESLPHGSLGSILIVWPFIGIAYMMRDAVQFSYENTLEKRQKSSGFWPSMAFVILALILTHSYRHPSVAMAGATAYFVASLVDGLVFSKLRNWGLCHRLLISNVFAAVFDSGIFMAIMIAQGHMNADWPSNILITLMEIAPALMVFLLGSTVFSRAFRLMDYAIVRQIKRG
jgi:uncharacterized PurR-regulated membrane protein YhhQ (DUF165 family)